MKTITMICWKRSDYLERSFASIMTNDLIEEIDKIYIFAEPDRPAEMDSLLNTITLSHLGLVEVHSNSKRLGVDKNGHQAIEHAFRQGSELNIHVEEDVILSKDAISMVFGMNLKYSGTNCLCMCLHNHNALPISGVTIGLTQQIHEFNPYGWACTERQWAFMSDEWFTNRWSSDGVDKYGWDWSINYHCAKAKTHYTLMPMVSRATTIGELGGVNMTPEQWRADFAKQEIL